MEKPGYKLIIRALVQRNNEWLNLKSMLLKCILLLTLTSLDLKNNCTDKAALPLVYVLDSSSLT